MSDEQIKTIRILLDRMDRGALLDAERELLRTLVLQVIEPAEGACTCTRDTMCPSCSGLDG